MLKRLIVLAPLLAGCTSNIVHEGELIRIKGCYSDRDCAAVAEKECPKGYDVDSVHIRACVDDCGKDAYMSWRVRCVL